MRTIKFRAWDGKRMTTSGIMFNCSLGLLETPNGAQMKLMQFTGLTDKNGVEVYEGDVCEVTYFNHATANSKIIQEVKFELGTFVLKKKDTVSEIEEDRTNVPLYYSFAPNKIEVIGNIYETKDQ